MSRVTPRELPRTLSPAQPQAVHPHRHSHTRSTRSATPSASRTCPRALLFRATATAVQAETDVGDARERSSPAHPSREAPGQPTVTSSDRLVRLLGSFSSVLILWLLSSTAPALRRALARALLSRAFSVALPVVICSHTAANFRCVLR